MNDTIKSWFKKVGSSIKPKLASWNLEVPTIIITPKPTIKTVNTTIDTADLTGILPVVSAAGNVNCTSIATGTNGQLMEIWGTSDTDTITITSATTNVKLQGGVDFTLGLGDNIVLRYITTGTLNKWCEISRCNNT